MSGRPSERWLPPLADPTAHGPCNNGHGCTKGRTYLDSADAFVDPKKAIQLRLKMADGGAHAVLFGRFSADGNEAIIWNPWEQRNSMPIDQFFQSLRSIIYQA